MGFKDMIEVSLAVDILTAKEAYEYCNHIHDKDYFIASSCCPVCVGLIKMLEPNAKVVFIGACTAKKKEAIYEDLVGDIDYVLTYQEVEVILYFYTKGRLGNENKT